MMFCFFLSWKFSFFLNSRSLCFWIDRLSLQVGRNSSQRNSGSVESTPLHRSTWNPKTTGLRFHVRCCYTRHMEVSGKRLVCGNWPIQGTVPLQCVGDPKFEGLGCCRKNQLRGPANAVKSDRRSTLLFHGSFQFIWITKPWPMAFGC